MTSSNGRFRVRRGDVEIEYEGVDFVQEYGAALRYLGIADKPRTGMAERESQPADINRGPSANSLLSPPSVAPSSSSPIVMSKLGSGESTREHDLESTGLDSIGPPERQAGETTEAAARSDETPFDAFLRRVSQGRKGSEERAEPKVESGEPASEGVTLPAQGDEKYKEVLKRLGIPS
jgi:hypothetical protein